MKGWFIQAIRNVVAIKPPGVFVSEYTTVQALTGNALDAGDALGTLFRIEVPVSGIFQSAHLLDRDDEGSELDIALFDARIDTVAAADAAFDLTDADAKRKIYQLNFTTFSDNVSNQDASIENIGKAYKVKPKSKGKKTGWMYAQAITRGTPTIAVGSEPMLRLEILPDEPI